MPRPCSTAERGLNVDILALPQLNAFVSAAENNLLDDEMVGCVRLRVSALKFKGPRFYHHRACKGALLVATAGLIPNLGTRAPTYNCAHSDAAFIAKPSSAIGV